MTNGHFDDLDINILRRRRGKKWHTFDPDVLPAWVADMDFPAAPPIRQRLQQALETSDLGYPHDDQPRRLIELLVKRTRDRFRWRVDPGRVEVIADVVQGLQMCLEMYSRPGQGAAILTPIYPPFLNATRAMGRRGDCCMLTPGADGYEIDMDRLEATVQSDTRLLLLCNPHNPTGRVLTRDELTGLAELALRRDLTVVADEIHADLVLDGRRHIPFASLGPEVESRTVTLTSATKAFNIAGLRCAMMVFGSAALHTAYRTGPRFSRGAASSLGMHAAEAAWSECDEWLAQLLRHLEGNRARIGAFLAEHLPDIGYLPPEATYLAWLDCRALEPGDSLWQTILDRGRLALNDGREFGAGGEECVRLNFATSTAILDDALARLRRALAPATP
ncbi:MAG: PatB family C-S lyase [Gammaproteobacteria bacterium]|nr:PatB family C-S lyase [Gammaproteobacteria bacterium]